jgi:methylmalonyl-CoA mutase N-terminal domain/subunit
LAYQKEIESGERIIVGVNAFTETKEPAIKMLKIKHAVERSQIRELRARKKQRATRRVRSALQRLERIAVENGNLMPPVLDAVRAEATVGEICDVLRKVYGVYREAANL